MHSRSSPHPAQTKIGCVQRGQTKYPYTSYHWEFPGGKIETGESPQQALNLERDFRIGIVKDTLSGNIGVNIFAREEIEQLFA